MESYNPAVLQGEKILLRRYRLEDADALWNSLGDAESSRLTGTHGTFTREQIDAYVVRQLANDGDERAAFVIAVPDDEALALGEVVINEVDPDNRSANIRIMLFQNAVMNKGYGTEAMRLMIDYGFKRFKLHRLSLGVYTFNPRAIRVYEKLGFKREGVLRDALYWQGEYVDEIVMSILEDEWTGLPQEPRHAAH